MIANNKIKYCHRLLDWEGKNYLKEQIQQLDKYTQLK